MLISPCIITYLSFTAPFGVEGSRPCLLLAPPQARHTKKSLPCSPYMNSQILKPVVLSHRTNLDPRSSFACSWCQSRSWPAHGSHSPRGTEEQRPGGSCTASCPPACEAFHGGRTPAPLQAASTQAGGARRRGWRVWRAGIQGHHAEPLQEPIRGQWHRRLAPFPPTPPPFLPDHGALLFCNESCKSSSQLWSMQAVILDRRLPYLQPRPPSRRRSPLPPPSWPRR